MRCVAGTALRGAKKKPLALGTMSGPNVEPFAGLVDLITFHRCANRIGHTDELCDAHLNLAVKYKKPLVCTEACRGSFDDQERGRQSHGDVEAMERRNIGWLLWQLCESRFVTGNRERMDDNTLHPGQGYIPFVLADDTTRPGHGWLGR